MPVTVAVSYVEDGLSVQFTDDSTGEFDNGPPISWSWTFGDGESSTEQNPTHTYSAYGVYTVNFDSFGPFDVNFGVTPTATLFPPLSVSLLAPVTPPTWEAGLSVDMVGIRAATETTFSSRCEVLNRSQFPDGQGGYQIADSDDDWHVVYSDVPCRIAELTGRESFLKNQDTGEGDWVLTLPVAFSVTERMRLTLEGQDYEIMLTNSHQAYRTAQRLLLRQFN